MPLPFRAALALALTSFGAGALHAQDLSQQARAAQQRGQLDSAYAIIQRAADAEPNRAEVHWSLGEIACQQAQSVGGIGALGLARKCKAGYGRAVELRPDSVPYLESFVGFLTQAPGMAGGDKDSALVLARRARRLDESRGIILEISVLRAGDSGMQHQSDSLLDWYAGRHPSDRKIQVQIAGIYAGTNRPEQSLAIHTRLLARDSNDYVARFGVGRNLVVLKRDPRTAQRLLRSVTTRTPPQEQPRWSPEAAWWRLGQTWVQLGVPDSARAAFEQSLRLNPQFRQARLSLDSLSRP